MSISKLRSKPGALGRQDNVKSTKAGSGNGAGAGAGAGGDGGEDKEAEDMMGAGANTTPQHAGVNRASIKTSTAATKLQQQQLQQQPSPPPPATPTPLAQQQQQHQQQQQQPPQPTNLPQTSLLKIEPFVPSLNTRLRRPFGRSYSTLSSTTCIKRTTTTTTPTANTASGAPLLDSPLMGAAIDGVLPKKATITTNVARPASRLRRNPARVVTRQRSKSTSSTAANRHTAATSATSANGNHTANGSVALTTATTNGPNASGVLVTTQPNGICRITRLTHEKEKLPDRINYDGRGLTAIPIFEQEPNLRLLSLQHNLINIFHIPKEPEPSPCPALESAKTRTSGHGKGNGNAMARQPAPAPAAKPDDADSNQSAISLGQGSPLHAGHSQLSRHINAQHGRASIAGNNSNNNNNIRLPYANLGGGGSGGNATGNGVSLRMHNLTPPPIAPPPSPLTAHTLPIGHGTPHVSHLLHLSRSALIQKNFNYHSPLLPISHQGAAPYRFGMKRSKSFVSNYARHLHNMKLNLAQAYRAQAEATHLKSFDSGTGTASGSGSGITTLDGHSELEEEADPLQQLEIKNKQLLTSYGMIFQHLVFLDLYDNQIERIGNLDGLPALSVLLLGKNRLTDIGGLCSLRQTLRVLDLHGNKISSISNKINCLQALKSLNLAGNHIRQINQNDFNGLLNLKELNLKRNKIKRINGFQHLGALERLWLCHNDLHRVEDMASIAKAANLLEMTIENNPVSLAGDCVSFLVSHLPQLQTLSQMPITEQVRRAAMAWRKNKEISDANHSHLTAEVFSSIKREEVISNARTNWELLRSQQTVQAATRAQQRSSKRPELAKICESNEAAVGYEEMQEFIKLPPIQQQQQQQQTEQNVSPVAPQDVKHNDESSNNSARLSGSSASSLGPNVDSSSSCYSSDVEEPPTVKLPTQRARVRKCQKTKQAARCGGGESGLRQKAKKANKLYGNNTASAAVAAAAAEQRPNDGTTAEIESRTDGDVVQQTANAVCTVANTTTTRHTVSLKANGDATTTTTSPQLTIMNSNQTNNNSSMPGKQNANTTTITTTFTASTTTTTTATVQQTLRPTGSAASTAATLTSAAATTARATTTGQATATAQTMGSGSTPGLSCREQHSNAGTVVTASATMATTTAGATPQTMAQTSLTTAPATTTAATTTRTTCRRYTQGSLMRSQTVVGSGASGNGSGLHIAVNVRNEVNGTNGGGRRNHSSHANKFSGNNNHSHMHTHLNGATANSGSGQSVPHVTCIIAPTPLAPTTATATSTLTTTTTTLTTATTSNSKTAAAAVGSKQAAAATAAAAAAAATANNDREREREQGGDYLIEICGRHLNVYGQGALRYIDKQWNPAKANDVHTLNFSYINFNNIAATLLARIKLRFPHAENFVFRETNISCLGQLNALAELQGIASLCIDPEGNAITTKDLWRQYAIYRLSHWGLKLLNGVQVTEAMVDEANAMHAGLSDLVLWAMPEAMLQPLLARLRLDETCTASRLSPKEWLMKPDNKSLRLVVGKEALQWKKPTPTATPSCGSSNFGSHHQAAAYDAGATRTASLSAAAAANNASLSMRERGKLHFALMLENTCNAVEKLHKLETLWPSLLLDIVRNTLLDYAQLEEYLRNLMSEIMK